MDVNVSPEIVATGYLFFTNCHALFSPPFEVVKKSSSIQTAPINYHHNDQPSHTNRTNNDQFYCGSATDTAAPQITQRRHTQTNRKPLLHPKPRVITSKLSHNDWPSHPDPKRITTKPNRTPSTPTKKLQTTRLVIGKGIQKTTYRSQFCFRTPANFTRMKLVRFK